MADHTIRQGEQGAYELHLTPGQPVTVAVEGSEFAQGSLQVIAHTGTAPVYVARGETVEPLSAQSMMVPPMTFADIDLGPGRTDTIAIVSAADATVSVVRQ